jgi:MFS family permease
MTRKQNPENVGVKGTLLVTSSLVPLGTVALAPALPAIGAEFQDIANAALWTSLVLSLPALFIAAASPFAGYIVDNVGRKNVLIVSVLMVSLAGLSGLIAPSIGILLTGRALIGIGVAGLMISTTTLIADYYVGDERSNLIGLQAAFMGIAGTALLLVVGVLAAIGWRTPFLIYLLPFVVLPFDLLLLFEPRHEERCADNPPPLGEPGSCVGESIIDGGRVPVSLAPAEPIPVKLIAFIYATIFPIAAHLLYRSHPAAFLPAGVNRCDGRAEWPGYGRHEPCLCHYLHALRPGCRPSGPDHHSPGLARLDWRELRLFIAGRQYHCAVYWFDRIWGCWCRTCMSGWRMKRRWPYAVLF